MECNACFKRGATLQCGGECAGAVVYCNEHCQRIGWVIGKHAVQCIGGHTKHTLDDGSNTEKVKKSKRTYHLYYDENEVGMFDTAEDLVQMEARTAVAHPFVYSAGRHQRVLSLPLDADRLRRMITSKRGGRLVFRNIPRPSESPRYIVGWTQQEGEEWLEWQFSNLARRTPANIAREAFDGGLRLSRDPSHILQPWTESQYVTVASVFGIEVRPFDLSASAFPFKKMRGHFPIEYRNHRAMASSMLGLMNWQNPYYFRGVNEIVSLVLKDDEIFQFVGPPYSTTFKARLFHGTLATTVIEFCRDTVGDVGAHENPWEVRVPHSPQTEKMIDKLMEWIDTIEKLISEIPRLFLPFPFVTYRCTTRHAWNDTVVGGEYTERAFLASDYDKPTTAFGNNLFIFTVPAYFACANISGGEHEILFLPFVRWRCTAKTHATSEDGKVMLYVTHATVLGYSVRYPRYDQLEPASPTYETSSDEDASPLVGE